MDVFIALALFDSLVICCASACIAIEIERIRKNLEDRK